MMPTDDTDTDDRKDILKEDIGELSKAHEKQVGCLDYCRGTDLQLWISV